MFRNDQQRIRALVLLFQQGNITVPAEALSAAISAARRDRTTGWLLDIVLAENRLSSGQRLLWHLSKDLWQSETAGVGAVALISGLDPDTGHAALSLCAAVARGPAAVDGWITAMEAGLLGAGEDGP